MRSRAEITLPPARSPDGDDNVVPLAAVPFDQVLAYDRTCFPVARPTFLKGWIAQPEKLFEKSPSQQTWPV
ncbi:MAG: hypothetical protein R2844_17460 [Caldilineales bacterium]